MERDQAGRLRPVKRGKKIPILVAQGVWPATGQTRLIAWMCAEAEMKKNRQTFLEMLWEAGLTPENGLKMLVSDGGLGFEATYQNVYWSVWRQRCVFREFRRRFRQALLFHSTIGAQAAAAQLASCFS